MVWHWITPPITCWAKAVPALPTISATSTTASVSTMAILFSSIVSYPSFAF
jgi:hypothetical protein